MSERYLTAEEADHAAVVEAVETIPALTSRKVVGL